MSGQSTTRRLKAKTGQLGTLLPFMCNIKNINKETYPGFSLVFTIFVFISLIIVIQVAFFKNDISDVQNRYYTTNISLCGDR